MVLGGRGQERSLQTQMATTGMQSLASSDFGRRTHHANTGRSVIFLLLQGSTQPYHTACATKAESVNSACLLHQRHSNNNPPHAPYTAAVATLLAPSSTPSHAHSAVQSLLAHAPSASPAPTATSFACDSPTKSHPRSELRLLQPRRNLHSTRAYSTPFTQ